MAVNNQSPDTRQLNDTLTKYGLELKGNYVNNKTPLELACLTCGLTFRRSWNQITTRSTKCPECSKSLRKSNSLRPEEIEKRLQAHNIKTDEEILSIDQRFTCVCITCGYSRTTSLHVLAKSSGCKSCNAKSRLMTKSNAAVQTMLEANFEPLEPFVSVHSPWKCKCKLCGQVSSPSLKTVKNSNSRCAFCRGLRITADDAVRAMLAVGLEPIEPYVSTHAPWRCICNKCGREALVKHSKAISRNQGCSYCNEVRPLVDLDETAKTIEAMGFKLLDSLSRTTGVNRAVHKICGNEVVIDYKRLKSGSGLCKWCAPNARIDPAEALRVMLDAGYKPIEEFVSNATKWKSIHEACGNEVRPTFKQIKNGLGGCRYCANWGFNYREPAIVYLITSRTLSAHKIGISNPNTNKSADRLAKHEREGWEIHKIWHFNEGKSAEMLESAVLRELRHSRGLPPFLTKADMKQDGYTETVSAQAIELAEIVEIVEDIIRNSPRNKGE